MKKVLTFIFLSILITSCSQNSSKNLQWIPFSWESGTDWGKYIEKMAIYLSVTIDELPYKLIMQLDLGTPSTVFYGKTLEAFLEKYPSLKGKLHTTKYLLMENMNLQLDDVVFNDIKVGIIYDYMGKELSLDTITHEIEIGTIGADLFQDKVLIIDYRLNRIAITDAVPSDYQNVSFVSFVNFRVGQGLIKIPFQINGNIEHLLFDTGGAYFCLMTTKKNALSIGGTEILDSLKATSWAGPVSFYGLETVVPVSFGEKIMESSIVYYYTEYALFDNFLKQENLWGVAGNGYFLNDVIIIDYKNRRFGVK